MKPKRPDSAKSAKTRITVDSEVSSNNITQSRMSETYSNGVKLNGNKNGDFEKYVAQKNKDPKFKKFLEPTMPEIPEQLKPSAELTKLTSKPFERKTSKTDKEKPEKKVEEAPKNIEEESKTVKKQNLQLSKTFMDKSKQKLKIPSKQDIEDGQPSGKIQQKNQNIQTDSKGKPKINLTGFVLNVPGKAPQVIKQQKVQPKVEETEEMRQRAERDRMMTQISEYVSEMETKNADFLPKRYDEFIDRNFRNQDMSIEMIRIDDFLEEPTEKDYENLMKKINQNQQKLQTNEKASPSRLQNNSSASINLDQILDSEPKKQDQPEQKDDISVIMSSMSASDVHNRNMFLTEILKGKRVTQESILRMKENDDTMMKLIKLEGNKEDQLDDSDGEVTEINMSKKKTHRIMERNKIQAAGDLYRECDYLSAEEQQRIQDLINGVPIYSPFQLTEMERLMSRRIDEGIKIHRQLCQAAEGNQAHPETDITIDQSTLPKDPILRKKAQLKILRDKISSINSRLSTLNNIVTNKAKVQSLIQKYKQVIRPSKMSESIINEKRKEIEEQCQQLREAQGILRRVEDEREEILGLVQEMSGRFGEMRDDVGRMLKMDAQQIRKLEQDKLKEKRRRVQEVEDDVKGFEDDINGIIQAGEEIKRKMEVLDQIMTVNSDAIQCEGFQEGQTIEDIDTLITRRWQAAEEAVRMSRDHQNQRD